MKLETIPQELENSVNPQSFIRRMLGKISAQALIPEDCWQEGWDDPLATAAGPWASPSEVTASMWGNFDPKAAAEIYDLLGEMPDEEFRKLKEIH